MFNRFRIRPWVFAYLAVMIAGLIASTVQAQGKKGGGGGGGGDGTSKPAYDFFQLDNDGGFFSPANYEPVVDLNDVGMVLGHVEEASLEGGPDRPAVWAISGSSSQITLLSNGDLDGVHAGGMNDLGEVVGHGWGQTTYPAVYWSSPTAGPISLPQLPGGWGCQANAISNSGLICGTQFEIDGRIGVAWRISESNGQVLVYGPVALPQSGFHTYGMLVSECDQNGRAQIVGGVGPDSTGQLSGLTTWTVELGSENTISLVATSAVFAHTVNSGVKVCGGNNLDISCGAFSTDGNSYWGRATLWNGGNSLTLANPPAKKGWAENDVHIAYDINDAGVIVGEARNQGYPGALLWPTPDVSEAIRLDSLLPRRNAAFTHFPQANAINNFGVIVGVGIDANGATQGFYAVPK